MQNGQCLSTQSVSNLQRHPKTSKHGMIGRDTMYSAALLEHFRHPRNAGELEHASAVVEVMNPVCGDVFRLAVRLEGGRIATARFQAQGCVVAIAAGSALTELLEGRTLDGARTLTASVIAERLGGLPPAGAHGAELAIDALRALLAQIDI
jgi:NifU-like protein involved in Fe-S cluster formation